MIKNQSLTDLKEKHSTNFSSKGTVRALRKLIVINTNITNFKFCAMKNANSFGTEQLKENYSLGRRQSLVIGDLQPGRKRPLNSFLLTNVCVVSPYYNQTGITQIKFKEVIFILTLQNFLLSVHSLLPQPYAKETEQWQCVLGQDPELLQ